MLATGFAVLIGFVVFLAFKSYDTSRSGAETEARIVEQQFETAQFLPVRPRARLSGELVCYARTSPREWPRMESTAPSATEEPVARCDVAHPATIDPARRPSRRRTPSGSTSDPTAKTARTDRIHGAEGVIPPPVWIVLFFASGVIFVYMLFFADSAERAVVQATMMGGSPS